MTRKKKFDEPSKTFGIRLPLSKFKEYKELFNLIIDNKVPIKLIKDAIIKYIEKIKESRK